MSTATRQLDELIGREYRHGFYTTLETDTVPRGLNEDIIRMIFARKMVCGRCAREFTPVDLQQLTVHQRDHNHENNPPDGSNCIYCHEHEHT